MFIPGGLAHPVWLRSPGADRGAKSRFCAGARGACGARALVSLNKGFSGGFAKQKQVS